MLVTKNEFMYRGQVHTNLKEAKIGFTTSETLEREYFVVNVVYPEGGGYYTSLPISSWEFRAEHPTPAHYSVVSSREVHIFDDWNRKHEFRFSDPKDLEVLLDNIVVYLDERNEF